MLTTKAFAELCNTTKKTLIHYDRIDLLKPHTRQGVFRLYEPKQVLVFQKIVLLKSFGVHLHDIPKYLKRDNLLLSLLENQKENMEVQKEILHKRIQKAKEFISSLNKYHVLVNPVIKSVKPYWIYGLEKKGRYVDIQEHQKEVFQILGDKQYEHAGLTIFNDNVFSPEKAHMFTGIYMGKEKPASISKLELIHVVEHKVLTYTHVGSYSYMSYIWQILSKYFVENKLIHHPHLKSREIYWRGSLAEGKEDNYVTELQIPLS